ncbi:MULTISPECIES: MFS transporter [Chryseobacterium]|jgi:Arabinose efflux permease|uniref:MFS family permease n=2 Tax=Chryseobacterium TaxID=59732 RepID=A0AAE3Y8Z0_9FLAO|nr:MULTISPECIES: MFS transporter [Chryseobacterium]MBL3546031.1 MHS family MFS transporter [Chryseobacterium sp. KMC2]MDC8100784.1 MHS family MFS transporter [Chryseobacterium rhizosphaerae]MDR6525816.1 MFS family permease [Chryseobacterium rhizosphaerae]MDR6544998.1 MFS family permease [Chryseobacterium rhizosphaerae]
MSEKHYESYENMTDRQKNRTIWSVITASSLGTLIEWYDFYIFGSLAIVLATKFFPADNPTAAFLSTLATFAAGFVVRPFGALFFGRLGDLIGRKYTFLVTLLIMGFSTFLIGCIPSYETIGFMAPVLVLILRLLQGLALGGEYGGAATYVAEYAQPHRRGYWTSWIQTTATAGLFISLIVILITRKTLSPEDFDTWGWRVPFWISILMVGVSYIIRKNMKESPLFAKAKSEGKTSKNPLKESFGNKFNFKFVLLALFGAAMGQGVIWYTGQFYAMSFLQKVMNVESSQVDLLMATALLLGTPFFVFFGWLSDKIGRKAVMMTGMLVAILAYRPIYDSMFKSVNLENKTVAANGITEKRTAKIHNDIATDSLVTIHKETLFTDGTLVKKDSIVHWSPTGPVMKDGKAEEAKVSQTVKLSDDTKWYLVFLVFIQVIFVTMVYGPIAAFLVEMFPVRIRYTSMSLPYHIGNGVFGGLLPAVATYLVTTGKEAGHATWYLEGLWYPIGVAAVCLLIGLIYLKNKNNNLHD